MLSKLEENSGFLHSKRVTKIERIDFSEMIETTTIKCYRRELRIDE